MAQRVGDQLVEDEAERCGRLHADGHRRGVHAHRDSGPAQRLGQLAAQLAHEDGAAHRGMGLGLVKQLLHDRHRQHAVARLDQAAARVLVGLVAHRQADETEQDLEIVLHPVVQLARLRMPVGQRIFQGRRGALVPGGLRAGLVARTAAQQQRAPGAVALRHDGRAIAAARHAGAGRGAQRQPSGKAPPRGCALLEAAHELRRVLDMIDERGAGAVLRGDLEQRPGPLVGGQDLPGRTEQEDGLR
jgi:hypothetical protein